MPRLTLGDFEMQVTLQGEGVPLLLVHGFPLDGRMWQGQVPALAANARLIVPDLRGFGESSLGTAEMTMERLADDLAELLTALGITEKVVLCGLSMGGYVAWQFWKRHSEKLRALILCDTKAAGDSAEAAATREKMAEHVVKRGTGFVAEAMLPKMFSAAALQADSAAVKVVREEILATNPHTIAAAQRAMAARPDMTSSLSQIKLPALVVVGEEDAITPADEMRKLAAALPQAEFVLISGAGHMAPLEQPEPVNDALRAFLKRTVS